MKLLRTALLSFASFLVVTPADAQMTMGGPSEAAPFGAPVDDQHIFYHLLLDQFEGRFGGENGFRWEGEAWAGTDTNRLWLKSEGLTSPGGKVEDADHELLYDRPISTYFDLQAGVRTDLDSRTGRTWAAFGIEGLAPLFFHVSATGYASDRGHLAGRLKGSYDLLLTQTLILQPELEMNFYTKDDPGRGIGAGLSHINTGLRLRYEISRKFAPYIGVTYENRFGDTARFSRLAGEHTSDMRFIAGARIWF